MVTIDYFRFFGSSSIKKKQSNEEDLSIKGRILTQNTGYCLLESRSTCHLGPPSGI